MYRFRAVRDQQQATTLHASKSLSQVIVRATRITVTHLHQPQTNLNLEFTIHENQEQSSKWAALQHTLKDQFEDILATEVLPTSSLRTHIFVLSQDADIDSVIFNSVWVCLVLHGAPLKRSVYCYQWRADQQQGKVVLDLNQPQTVFSGEYKSAPPENLLTACQEYRKTVAEFLKREWAR